MSWNYRIVRYRDSGAFGLHEVYYNKAGEPTAMTAQCCTFGCDDEDGPQGIVQSLARAMNDAVNRPVLEEPITWGKSDPDEDEDDGDE